MHRRSRLIRTVVTAVIGLTLLSTGFVGGIFAASSLALGGIAVAQAQQSQPKDFQLFWQAWSLVERNFVDQGLLDSKNVTYSAIQGMLEGLGDVGHTRFLTPDEQKAERTSIQGRIEGIGAEVANRDGRITIVTPLDGSPAQQAGLKPGDVLVQVNGEDITGQRLEEVVDKVRGPAGSSVKLVVLRPDESKLYELTITRASVQVRNVRWAMIPDTGIAYIRISQFADGVTDDLKQALNTARSQGATGVVLDLRNNPGGLLDQAIGVTSQFLSSGNVLLEENKDGNQRAYAVRSGGIATDVPLVVLINRGSASGSEVVAGALQDNHRATLVGERTFGTGTVLNTFRLDDGSALMLAVANWLTPDGRKIKGNGIQPDVTVSLPLNTFPASPQQAASGDPAFAEDTQLQQAIQTLRTATGG